MFASSLALRAPAQTADDFNPQLGNSAYVTALAVQPDGKILIGGAFSSVNGVPRHGLGRLNPDGTLDANFLPDPNVGVDCLALQPDGKIVVGGLFTTLGGQPRNGLGRLNADGSLDAGFLPGVGGTVNCLALQPDGKILAGGRFYNGGQWISTLFRVNPDGSPDAGFAPTGPGEDVYALAVQADGKILVGGTILSLGGQSCDHLGRLNADGSLDESFKSGAHTQFGGIVEALVVQPDGKILVAGDFSQLAGQVRYDLGRLNADGTLDAAFDAAEGESGSYLHSVALQADGKIVVGGLFYSFGGQSRANLARLNADGSVDSAFNPGAGHDVISLALQVDGKILVGGYFSTLGGQSRIGFGRVTNDGVAGRSLGLTADGATLTWSRSGASPEVEQVTFEQSPDGATYTLLGQGTRISGGWQLGGLSLPMTQTFYLRARGRATGGLYNSSSGLIEFGPVRYSPPPPVGPEINVLGQFDQTTRTGVGITAGDTTPSPTDGTDFGLVLEPGGIEIKTFAIQNTGNATLTITQPITLRGPNAADFILSSPPVASLSAGATMPFAITFNPSAPGVRRATVTIGSDDPDENPYTFAIQGTATPAPDTTPPVIASASANPGVLWPPNRQMVPVTVRVQATDDHDPAPVSRIVAVTSNQPASGMFLGGKTPDWEITGPLTVNLRAERAPSAGDRVYTITVECTDAAGNRSTSEATVNVPVVPPRPKR